MKEAIRKTVLKALQQTIVIFRVREEKDIDNLKILSDEVIEDVAVSKDLDVISLTVLIYSLYKIVKELSEKDYQNLLKELQFAQKNLQQNNLAKYNKNMKVLFELVKGSNVKVKEHLADVLHAARIKKSAILMNKGLSLGQAAGLMGLSNWDLQQYVGHTSFMEQQKSTLPTNKRLDVALQLFGAK